MTLAAAAPPAPPGELQLTLSAATVALAQDEDDGLFDGDNPGLSYTFIEVGATRLDLEDIDDEADTYYGLASIGLFDFLYGFLGYENQSTDFDDADTDLWSLGVGVHFGLMDKLDAVADAAWLYSDLNGDTIDEEDSGFKVRAGGRWRPMRLLEVEGHGVWYSIDDSLMSDDSTAGFDAGARAHFGPFSLGLMYEMLGDDDKAGINGRLSF
jgi:hypothetical protein